FQPNGFAHIDALTGSGTVQAASAAGAGLTVGANGGGGTFSGVIQDGSGPLALVKTGGGTQALSGANTYSGGPTPSGGVLQLGAANALPSGPGQGNVAFNPASGTATLDLNGFSPTLNALSSSGAGGGVVDNTAAAAVTLTVGNGDASGTFAGVLRNA